MKLKIARKNWLIYPNFQLLLILFNVLIVSLGYLAVLAGLNRFFAELQKTGTDSGLGGNHYYFVFLGNQSNRVYQWVAVAWLFSIVLGAVSTLLISHKIVGPIYRLRTYFQNIAKGDVIQPLSFRKGDFFADLPDAVNRALQK